MSAPKRVPDHGANFPRTLDDKRRRAIALLIGGAVVSPCLPAWSWDHADRDDPADGVSSDDHDASGPARSGYLAVEIAAFKLTDMNQHGEVVGVAANSPGSFATLWTWSTRSGYQLTDLGAPGGTRSSTGGLNNRGQVVGMVDRPGSTRWQPVLWTGRRSVMLNTLGGDGGVASSINDRGDIVGTSSTGSGDDWPTLWVRGVPQALPTLGGTQGLALRINERGVIVGYATDLGNQHALPVRWVRTAVQALGTLGGTMGSARGINASGVAVGNSTNAAGVTRATLWHGTNPFDLGALPGLASSAATDINDDGQVVGYSQRGDVAGEVPRATLWSGAGVLDLNACLDAEQQAQGWVLSVPRRINNAGWIACQASNTLTHETGNFVLMPRGRSGHWRR